MLLLYILLLGMLAAFTAYARHLQSTVITLEQQIPGAAGKVATPGQQTLRTLTLVLGWPAALGIGMLFGCAQSLRRHGATMVLVGSSGFVDNALRTVGAHEIIPFAETMEDALRLARQSRS